MANSEKNTNTEAVKKDNLRGGTNGDSAAPLIQPGGTNALSPSGTARVEGSQSGHDENSPRQIPEDAPTPDGRTGND